MGTTRSYDPHTRLTHLADTVLQDWTTHPDYKEGDCAIVMLYDEAGNGGIGISGYEEDADAITDILMHLTAIFEANGKSLQIIPMAFKGQG